MDQTKTKTEQEKMRKKDQMDLTKQATAHERKLLERLDLDGFNELHKSKSVKGKVVWAFVAVVAYFFAVGQTGLILHRYHSGKTIISIETLPPSDPRNNFPQVHLCHTGDWNKTYFENNIDIPNQIMGKAVEIGLTKSKLLFAFSKYMNYFTATSTSHYKFSDEMWNLLTELFDHVVSNSVQFLNFVYDASLAGQRIFSKCKYSEKAFKCVQLTNIQEIPSCYYLHTSPNISLDNVLQSVPQEFQNENGDKMSLKFEISVPTKHLFNESLPFEDEEELGVRLILDAPTPFSIQYAIPANTHAIVNFDQTHSQLTSKCYDDTKLPRLPHLRPLYNDGLCLADALIEEIWKECHCEMLTGLTAFIIAHDETKNRDICTPNEIKQCALAKVFLPLIERDDVRINQTKAKCKPRCSYTKQLASVTFYNLEHANDTVTSVVTIRPILEQRYSKEETPLSTIYTLFCDIGGVVGVWTGLSCAAFARVIGLLIWASMKEVNKKIVKPKIAKWSDVPLANPWEKPDTRMEKSGLIRVARTIQVAPME